MPTREELLRNIELYGTAAPQDNAIETLLGGLQEGLAKHGINAEYETASAWDRQNIPAPRNPFEGTPKGKTWDEVAPEGASPEGSFWSPERRNWLHLMQAATDPRLRPGDWSVSDRETAGFFGVEDLPTYGEGGKVDVAQQDPRFLGHGRFPDPMDIMDAVRASGDKELFGVLHEMFMSKPLFQEQEEEPGLTFYDRLMMMPGVGGP